MPTLKLFGFIKGTEVHSAKVSSFIKTKKSYMSLLGICNMYTYIIIIYVFKWANMMKQGAMYGVQTKEL